MYAYTYIYIYIHLFFFTWYLKIVKVPRDTLKHYIYIYYIYNSPNSLSEWGSSGFFKGPMQWRVPHPCWPDFRTIFA